MTAAPVTANGVHVESKAVYHHLSPGTAAARLNDSRSGPLVSPLSARRIVVLFGVSRLLGLTAHAVWSRALGKPIERPKSLTTHMLEEMVKEPEVVKEEVS